MKKLLLLLALFVASAQLNAQSIAGIWKTSDRDTGEAESHVTVFEKDGQFFGNITKLLQKRYEGAVCTKCNGDQKNKPVLGMTIMMNMVQKGNKWLGKVLDVKSGKTYSCQVKVKDDKLELRAYIGSPLLGRTLYWVKL